MADTVALPPIPDEAITEAASAMYEQWGGDDVSQEGYLGAAPAIIAAAWPHLYAAAVRHAAKAFVTADEQYRQRTGGNVCARLHRLADEATRG